MYDNIFFFRNTYFISLLLDKTVHFKKQLIGIPDIYRTYLLKLVYTLFSGDPFFPVELYKAYADRRPEQMCQPDSRFYIAVNPHYGAEAKNGQQ